MATRATNRGPGNAAALAIVQTQLWPIRFLRPGRLDPIPGIAFGGGNPPLISRFPIPALHGAMNRRNAESWRFGRGSIVSFPCLFVASFPQMNKPRNNTQKRSRYCTVLKKRNAALFPPFFPGLGGGFGGRTPTQSRRGCDGVRQRVFVVLRTGYHPTRPGRLVR